MNSESINRYSQLKSDWKKDSKEIILKENLTNLTTNKTKTLYRASIIPRPSSCNGWENPSREKIDLNYENEQRKLRSDREFWIVVRGIYLPESFKLISPPDEFHGPILIKLGEETQKTILDSQKFLRGIKKIEEEYKGINLLQEKSFLVDILRLCDSQICLDKKLVLYNNP
jgi:hypothetical protein